MIKVKALRLWRAAWKNHHVYLEPWPQKPPLSPREVWSIWTRLQISGAAKDLVLFNLAIDSKLRGCDLVALRVGDVAIRRGA